MIRLDGKILSQELRQTYKQRLQEAKKDLGLAVVLVGDDVASATYVKNKVAACHEVGIRPIEVKLSAETTEEELQKEIEKLNSDKKVHGILVQLPLPSHLSEKKVLSWIHSDKDVDVLSAHRVAELWSSPQAEIAPCTPSGIIALLKHYKIPIEGKTAVVIGRSAIVGLPMLQLLQKENATVTLCHSRTQDLKKHTQSADIVVVAAGQPQFIGKDYFKKDAVVIDVGVHRVDGKLCGDVDPTDLEDHLQALSPVPGGVGPMTIAQLLQNTCVLGGVL